MKLVLILASLGVLMSTQNVSAQQLQPELHTKERPGQGVSPLSAEVEEHILKLEKEHPKLVKVRKMGQTFEKRAIYAVEVTDPTVKDELKQNVLVVAGQHGNEESGRMVALALLDWLVTDEAATTRKKQKIVVVPNANPDGADHNLHLNVQKYRINMDQPMDAESVTPEGKAIRQLGHELKPELYVDCHALGGSGVVRNIVMYPWTRQNNEDDNLVHRVASDMVKAGDKAGIPHITHSLVWWGPVEEDKGASTLYFYRKFKSLVILTEEGESDPHRYPRELIEKVGLARWKALLEYGNVRDERLYYEGYPTYIFGMFDWAVVAVGETAAQRRASRYAIWQNFTSFNFPRIELPAAMKRKVISFAYKGEMVDAPYGVYLRAGPKMKVKSVTLDGKAAKPSETDGYYSWQDEGSTMLVVAMPKIEKGSHQIVVEFE